jgi:pyrimidine-nucleoside phosphorylase
MSYAAVDLIEMKRDGGTLDPDQIRWLIRAYTIGEVPDYQMSAMAMAILFKGLNVDELATWTEAMIHSGDVMDFSDIPAKKVDKHSTGGVGDKISIPLAPLVAVCGVVVPMISGRSLGHTGGTLDKLESIPGFTTGLDADRFRSILVEHGVVIAGASKSIVPADRKLYSLRDATGTVPSIPLISSSIMSKKLAEGLDGLLLDVKTGSGAQTKARDRSRDLAKMMVGVGEAHGVHTIAYITSMEEPLGREVGNSNEIRESIEVLRGEGPEDVTELTLSFGEAMLDMADIDGGRERLQHAIDSGAALEKLIEVTRAQGGDPSVLENTDLLEVAPNEGIVRAQRGGYVTRCDALTIGIGATRLGAGRQSQEDEVDHGVAVSVRAKLGDEVAEGDPLAIVRYREESRWQTNVRSLASAWSIGDEPPSPSELILERIDRDSL